MSYSDALKECVNENDVVAILVTSKKVEFVKITIGDKSSIEKYLEKTDGQAMSIVLREIPYYVILGEKSDSFLFLRGKLDNRPFNNVIKKDLNAVDYLQTLI